MRHRIHKTADFPARHLPTVNINCTRIVIEKPRRIWIFRLDHRIPPGFLSGFSRVFEYSIVEMTDAEKVADVWRPNINVFPQCVVRCDRHQMRDFVFAQTLCGGNHFVIFFRRRLVDVIVIGFRGRAVFLQTRQSHVKIR